MADLVANLDTVNPILGDDVAETLERASDVLDFLAEFHMRKTGSEPTEKAMAGQVLVLECVRDALLAEKAALDSQKSV